MKVVSIEDIAEKVDYGLTEKAKDEKVGPKFLRITDIQNDKVNWETVPYCKCDEKEFEKNKLEVGDIVFARTGATTGKSFLVQNLDHKAVYASYLIRLRLITDQVLPEFVSYFFKSDKYWNQIYADSDGATLPSFNATKLKALKIPLPSLSEQKAIVAKLDRAQRLIDIDQEMLAKYDELIQSVFLEMFGDPVTNSKELPKRKIKDIGEVVTGNTPPKKDPKNYGSEIEWVKTTNITDDQLYPTKAEEYLSEKGKELGRIIPENSLIVCCIAGSLSSIGKCSIVNREISINQQINAIVPNPEIIDTTFLYAQFLVGKKLIQDASTKSMKGMVSKSKFQKIKLLVPYLNDQIEFSNLFKKIGDEKLKLRSTENKSEELFSSLVQGAFG